MARFSRARTQELEALLRPLIEGRCLQQHAAAAQLGVSEDWVQRACSRLGLATQRTGPRSGEQHPGWKHGSKLIKGYRYLYCADHHSGQRYVAEHRLVVEREIGRPLRRSEVVHHIDGDSLNNAAANLQVFSSNAEHLRHELTGRTPNWTDDGKRKIQAGILKAAASNRSRKYGGGRRPQPSARPT